MSGVLYIVATPIGNLDDISLRAIATLQAVELIAAEDTRHSKQLLNHLGIDTRLISCHEHNEAARSGQILEVLEGGGDVALISDAGTPLISDPGYRLVNAARDAGIRVSPVPGASSVAAALCAAGLPTEQFHFYGFLSAKPARRLAELKNLKPVQGTLVLFESSHRILALLQQLCEVFATERCVIAKELTKLHEQYLDGQPQDLLDRFEQDPNLTRGEFVVLIDNSNATEASQQTLVDTEILDLLLTELPVKAASRIAARLTGGRKNDLYQLALTRQGNSPKDWACSCWAPP